MALTVESEHRLKSKDFHKFYKSHEANLKGLVKSAEAFVRTYIPKGETLRADDVVGHVIPALRVNSAFVEHCEKQRLSSAKWAVDFADYIVEQVHPTKIGD